jgi:hypothetical protein
MIPPHLAALGNFFSRQKVLHRKSFNTRILAGALHYLVLLIQPIILPAVGGIGLRHENEPGMDFTANLDNALEFFV